MNCSPTKPWLWLNLLFLSSASTVFGETTSPATADGLAVSPLAALLRVLGALAIVLAVFGAMVWAFKNWQRFFGQNTATAKLRVLEVKFLGQRQALYVASYEEQRLLLAACPNGITLLAKLPPGPALNDVNTPKAQASRWPALGQRLLRQNGAVERCE